MPNSISTFCITFGPLTRYFLTDFHCITDRVWMLVNKVYLKKK